MATKKLKTANTDALFDYFRRGHDRAASEQDPLMRQVAQKTAHASEWHTLFAVLLVEPMSAIFDTDRVATRLEQMKRAILARGRLDPSETR